jgi:hypothetical protein
MSDSAQGMEHLKKARKHREGSSEAKDESPEPKNLSPEEESAEATGDDHKNLSTDAPKEDRGSAPSPSSEESSPESSPSTQDPPSEPSSDTRSRSSRSRRKKSRTESSPSRQPKAFMFGPQEERRFNLLLADVKSLVRQEDPDWQSSEQSLNVQNSQLVRAMVEMTIEDLAKGQDLIIDYVLDQIKQEREGQS